ncbi:amidase [Polaribacter reichenbachii]|uniref:Amidase n=1 Tax=Polaribacter reichenbachii TaxID=996801 RepID=A0A1B8TPV6_9FLAO|nr:amidase family protein [Polaribacter reichenbachii]APZ46796.1 amidase [Polaribacter reichenbachii]AUC17439.1 amidase [Polaribacter reichenbachii]OBY61687.1 amidase [Polaribacter reichenbachii]
MKNFSILMVFMLLIYACKEKQPDVIFAKYDETDALISQQNHKRKRMQFKLFQSKVLDMNDVFKPFQEDLAYFSEEDYQSLKPLILEQDIPTLQKSIKEGKLSYEKLTLFYLYRIRKFESDSTKSLNSIIALNPNVIEEARKKDKAKKRISDFSIYGMPILLKDNINTKEMPTTAGAIALQRNYTKNDAFIVEKLKEKGALILGKVNLSEWAYYFCSGCPLGYSAIGGQTLNPYGRGNFETGGSSSGSGVAVATNFAVAAVGTETSGSITSPSSLNSVVGLKPTIGVLSRTGIVPISSTLDTPGPMTKSVIDNAIFLEAMLGYDKNDTASKEIKESSFKNEFKSDFKGVKLGVLKTLLSDSIYALNIEKLRKAGAEIVEITPPEISFNGFRTLLNIDMKHDLPKYLSEQADKSIFVKNVNSVVAFNKKDSLLRAPYGQQLFDGIVNDSTTLKELEVIKNNLKLEGEKYLQALKQNNLDAILSINNYHSGIAAVALHPTLTVPMGYKASGEPISLTFVGKPFSERKLLEIGYAFEALTKARKIPENYQ